MTSGNKTASGGKLPTTPTLNPNAVQTAPGVGNLPHTPPINPGGGPPGNPNAGQNTTGVANIPSTPPFNPGQNTTGGGSVPHTPPINPGGQPPNNPNGGPKTVPLDPVGGPTPVPVPTDVNGGQTTTSVGNLPHTPPFNPNSGGQHKHVGVSVDTSVDPGPNGDHPCWWLKRKYDQTGNVDWFNRYRQCLSWRYSD